MAKKSSPEEIDRWINTKDTETIYEKYKVPQGITNRSDFIEKLKSLVPPAMAKYLGGERGERLFNDYSGLKAEELTKEKDETQKEFERKIEERMKELGHFSKKQLYKGPRIFSQKGRTGREYSRKYQLWTPQQIRWLSNRTAQRNNKLLTSNFNKYFGTFRSSSSIQTKKLRLKKK